jgi:hypothetical protein
MQDKLLIYSPLLADSFFNNVAYPRFVDNFKNPFKISLFSIA